MTEQLTGHEDERVHRSYTHAVEGTEQIVRAALETAFPGAGA